MAQVKGPQILPLLFSCFPLLLIIYILAPVHFGTFHIRQGLLIAPQYGSKVQTLLIYKFGTPNLALYALALNHVFGQ